MVNKMVIKLVLDPWCSNCPEFEAKTVSERLVADNYSFDGSLNEIVETFITCEHKNRCAGMVNYLKRHKED